MIFFSLTEGDAPAPVKLTTAATPSTFSDSDLSVSRSKLT